MLNLKFALRTLFKTPFVTIVAIVSLALGIGANAAIFSLFNQMLLRPLPVPEPDRLVNLAVPGPKPGSTSCGQAGGCDDVFSYPMFRDLEKIQTVFTALGAHVSFAPTSRRAARRRTAKGCSSPAAISRPWASSRRSGGCSALKTTARSASRTSSCSATRIGSRASASTLAC
jgi:hypothetical protein